MGQIWMERNGMELFSGDTDTDTIEQIYMDTDGTGSTLCLWPCYTLIQQRVSHSSRGVFNTFETRYVYTLISI